MKKKKSTLRLYEITLFFLLRDWQIKSMIWDSKKKIHDLRPNPNQWNWRVNVCTAHKIRFILHPLLDCVEKTRIGSGIKRHLAGQIPNSSRGKKKLGKKFKIGTRREKKTMKGQAPKGSVKKFKMWVSSFFYPRSFWPMNSRWKFICKITINRPTSQNLVPIRVDFEVEGQRFKDSFTWNPSGKSWILYVFFFIFVFFFFFKFGFLRSWKIIVCDDWWQIMIQRSWNLRK